MDTIDMPSATGAPSPVYVPSSIDGSSHRAPIARSPRDGAGTIGAALRHLEEAGLTFVEVGRCPAPRCPACHRSTRHAA